MSRLRHREHTVAETAAHLGLSKRTTERAQRSALRKLRQALADPSDASERTLVLSVGEVAYLHGCAAAQRAYCERLMRLKPGFYPPDDPPPGL